jgi:hypothetical protein
MTLDDLIDGLQRFPDALTDADHESLGKAGDIVVRVARQRIPTWTGKRPDPRAGTMKASITTRRIGENTQQVYSNHPGAEVNEQDPRWRRPPEHWFTTSLIDSVPDIKDLFHDGIREKIRILIRP